MTTKVNLSFVDSFRKTAQHMLDQGLHHGYFCLLESAPVVVNSGTDVTSRIPFDKYLVTRQSYHKFQCNYQGTIYELEL